MMMMMMRKKKKKKGEKKNEVEEGIVIEGDWKKEKVSDEDGLEMLEILAGCYCCWRTWLRTKEEQEPKTTKIK